MLPTRDKRGLAWRLTVVAVAAGALLLVGGASALAQEEVDGEVVYLAACAACHQADGGGLPGSFPPLADNPHVDDAAYVAGVIQNGLSGAIEVDGVVYDGQMPAVSLTDAEQAAVIAYVQSGFGGSPQLAVSGSPPEDEQFPWSTLLLFATVVAVVGGIAYFAYPAAAAPMTWRRGWALGVVITLYFVLATVWLPSQLLEDPAFADWPAAARDVLASAVWVLALGVGLAGLRLAQRKDRI